ncbi:MAG TPA: hypothetical protein ENI27_06480 [bacterium]|nr:hypothetical protein [bacterium]
MPKKIDGDWLKTAWFLADKYPREPDKVAAFIRMVYHKRRGDTYGASQLAFDMEWTRKKARDFIGFLSSAGRLGPGGLAPVAAFSAERGQVKGDLGPGKKALEAIPGGKRGQLDFPEGPGKKAPMAIPSAERGHLSFEEFWKIYPRKVAKQKALKSWNMINPDNGLAEKINNAVKSQTRGWNDPKYIPHPATWLNQRRWEDDSDTAQVKPDSAFERRYGKQVLGQQDNDESQDDVPD